MVKNEGRPIDPILIFTAVLVILVNLAILIATIACYRTIGWWSLSLIVGSLSSISLAVMAVKENNRALLLLDVILP